MGVKSENGSEKRNVRVDQIDLRLRFSFGVEHSFSHR